MHAWSAHEASSLVTSKARGVLVAGGAVVFALFVNAFTPVNFDLGWMLAFGRDTVAHGALARTNALSFTEPRHPVALYEWGACLAAYLLHARWGAAGVIALKWSLLVVAMLGVAACVRRVTASALVQFVTLFGVASVSWISFELVRAQLATYALLPLVVLAALRGDRRSLWSCVPIFALWTNLHGGFLAGLAVLAALCGALWLERRVAPEQAPGAPGALELAGVVVASLAACALNPEGPRIVTDTFRCATDPTNAFNLEWLPLLRTGTPHATFELVGGVLVAASAVLAFALLPWRRVRLWALVAIAVATSLSANRHLRIAPILLAPAVALAFERARARAGAALARLESLVPVVAAAVALPCAALFAANFAAETRFVETDLPTPAAALAVIRMNGLFGRTWNAFNFGGMLLWAVPESPVSCDGRHVMAYSPRMVTACVLMSSMTDDPMPMLEHFKAELLLLEPQSPALARAEASGKFRRIYCDRAACLLSSKPEHWKPLRLPPERFGAAALFDEPLPPAL